MKINFESENADFLASLRDIAERVTPAATAKAINDTARTVIKKTRQEVAAETGIQQKWFTRRIKVRKGSRATSRRLVSLIWVGVWEIPVAELTPRPRKMKGTGQVRYKTLPGRSLDPRAFVAPGKKGVTAFARKGSTRLPIKQKTVDIGPAVRRRVWMNLGGPSQRRFREVFYREMDFRVGKVLARRGMEVNRL